MIKGIARGLIVFLLAVIFSVQGVYAEPVPKSVQTVAEYTLEFPSSRYPETGAHIRDAIAAGHSPFARLTEMEPKKIVRNL